jgi:hypothetical protein
MALEAGELDLWIDFDNLFSPIPTPPPTVGNDTTFALKVAQIIIQAMLVFESYDSLPLVYQKEFCCAQRNSSIHCILLPHQFQHYLRPLLQVLDPSYDDAMWLQLFQTLHLHTILECHMHPITLLSASNPTELLCFSWRMRLSEYSHYIMSPTSTRQLSPKIYPLHSFAFRKSRRPYISHHTSVSARSRMISFLIPTRFILDASNYPCEQTSEVASHMRTYSDSIMHSPFPASTTPAIFELKDNYVHVPYDFFLSLCAKADLNDVSFEEVM